jgi:hypothetical protein
LFWNRSPWNTTSVRGHGTAVSSTSTVGSALDSLRPLGFRADMVGFWESSIGSKTSPLGTWQGFGSIDLNRPTIVNGTPLSAGVDQQCATSLAFDRL